MACSKKNSCPALFHVEPTLNTNSFWTRPPATPPPDLRAPCPLAPWCRPGSRRGRPASPCSRSGETPKSIHGFGPPTWILAFPSVSLQSNLKRAPTKKQTHTHTKKKLTRKQGLWIPGMFEGICLQCSLGIHGGARGFSQRGKHVGEIPGITPEVEMSHFLGLAISASLEPGVAHWIELGGSWELLGLVLGWLQNSPRANPNPPKGNPKPTQQPPG